jgi:hypothetical protein
MACDTGCCACDVPSPALFDFGDVELEEVVKPGDEFLSAHTPWSALQPQVWAPLRSARGA